MGTVFTIYLYAADNEQAAADFEMAFAEVDRLDATLSNYLPGSELSRINRNASQEAVTTDPEVFEFLRTSFDYARRSDGAFDISVGPLMRAWGFFRGQGHYPSDAELAQARTSVGWEKVTLDPASRTVRFQTAGMELDPGGIGKGYAVDQVVSLLRESGVQSALIDAGSSTIYALGAPPGKNGWPVQIPRPENRKRSVTTVLLRDTSLSTSGNYEKFFTLNGRLYCHIMDPRTGMPVEGMLQTTVIVPQATDSDALSTAMFVMGPARGAKLLQSLPSASGLWIMGRPKAATRMFTWQWPTKIPGATEVRGLAPSKDSAVHNSQARDSKFRDSKLRISRSGGCNHP
jgi:thiamine biosynthesis lipoprotein